MLTQEALLASELAEDSTQLAQWVCFSSAAGQTDQSRPKHTPSRLCYQSSPYSGSHTKLALITPGPGIKQLEAAPMHQSSLKLLRIANSKPVYPASLFLPEEDTVKAFIHSPLLTLPPERPPTASPHASCHGTFSLSFATLSSKQSFQWQSSPELWTLPYLSNKIY